MKVAIDTCSLMALVRYYLPFDKDDSLKNFIKNKVYNKEIIVLDKVSVESKRVAKGLIIESLGFIEDKKNILKTDNLLPEQGFLRDLENRFCYTALKNKLNETEFENRKQAFLDSADVKLILFCSSIKSGDRLNLEPTILVTEETRSENDSKLFKKLPEICELLKIEHCNLPTLLKTYFGLKMSNYLK
jgi:hypothetical protein